MMGNKRSVKEVKSQQLHIVSQRERVSPAYCANVSLPLCPATSHSLSLSRLSLGC